MAANKVTLNGETLIDLTQDTANESDVAVGKTFHKSNGEIGIGTNSSIGGGGSVIIETEVKTVTPTKQTQEVTPSDGKYLSKVTVNPIPDEYVVPNGTRTLSENAELVDVTELKYVNIRVPTNIESINYYDGSYEVR